MRPERRAARAALDRYLGMANPPAALLHELLGAVAAMVAIDTNRKVSFVVDGFLITRQADSVQLRFAPDAYRAVLSGRRS